MIFFFKQKTAYEMRISDWSSDVCSSDLADVLEDMAAQGHLLPLKILEWRQIAKLKNTYADSLTEQINPTTGRVHTTYGLTSTSTGRLSSSNPNLQNIPVRSEEGRKIRKAFVAEADRKSTRLNSSH